MTKSAVIFCAVDEELSSNNQQLLQIYICTSLPIIPLDICRGFEYSSGSNTPLKTAKSLFDSLELQLKLSYREWRPKDFRNCLSLFLGFNHSFHKRLTVSSIEPSIILHQHVRYFFFSFCFFFVVTHLVLTNTSVLIPGASNIFDFILPGSSLENLIMQEKNCYFENHKHFTST